MWFIDLDTVYYVDFLQIFTESKNQASDVLPFLPHPLLLGWASTYTFKLSRELIISFSVQWRSRSHKPLRIHKMCCNELKPVGKRLKTNQQLWWRQLVANGAMNGHRWVILEEGLLFLGSNESGSYTSQQTFIPRRPVALNPPQAMAAIPLLDRPPLARFGLDRREPLLPGGQHRAGTTIQTGMSLCP